MRILVVTNRNSGVGYHRLMLPVYYMEKEFAFFTDIINDEILSENYDILLINRYIHNVELTQILEYKRKYNFKLIVDIDDYWNLDPWHILYNFYPTQKVIEHIKAADIVTCTNSLLYKEILPLNKTVYILPNALPYGKDQFTDIKTNNDKTTIVYTGSITHSKDIELLKYPAKKIYSDKLLKDKTKFVICGYEEGNEYSKYYWQKMVTDFTYSFKLNSVIKKSLPVDQYMNFYNDADISLVPLVASKFNSMKSNLKVLEAAAKKIPAIASNVQPYTGNKIIPINNQSDWYKAIKKTVNDENYRIDKGLENYEYCNANYNLFKINIERKQIFDYASN